MYAPSIMKRDNRIDPVAKPVSLLTLQLFPFFSLSYTMAGRQTGPGKKKGTMAIIFFHALRVAKEMMRERERTQGK